MIDLKQVPLPDPERAELHAWLNSPGRLIYQRVLNSQAAEHQAKGAFAMMSNDQNSESEAKEAIEKARVLVAASQLFNQMLDKQSKNVYLVELQPQPPIKT